MSASPPPTSEGISRRELLRGSAAGSVGVALGSFGGGGGPAVAAEGAQAAPPAGRRSTVTIGVISDTHIRDTARAEITPLEDQTSRYQRFTDSMNQVVKPDFVVQLGDLNDGCGDTCQTIVSEDEAVRRIEIARSLIHDKLTMPVHDVMGNHEYRDPAWDKARIHHAINPRWTDVSDTWRTVSVNGFEFVFLNTGYTDTVSGDHTVPAAEVEWLERTLDRIKRPTFVFMHVPASSGNGGRYDQFNNQDSVKELLARHRRRGYLAAGFFGHCHHAEEWDRMRTQADDYGNFYYHVTAPHQWMGDPTQVPWAVIEITDDALRFSVGSGVDQPNGYQTEWFQTF